MIFFWERLLHLTSEDERWVRGGLDFPIISFLEIPQTSQVLQINSLNNYNQLQAAQDKHFSERRENDKLNLTLQLLQYHI